MNLVQLIQDQLSGEAIGKLSSLLGADRETTERASAAAVPSILSGLAGMASNDAGAKKLAGALGDIDTGGIGNFAQILGGGDAGSLLSKGQGLLGSLVGDSLTSGVAGAISRFAGLDANLSKKLIGYVLPLVMKVVGGQWQSRGGSPSALTSMFAEQKKNISDAIPAGFSLPQIPGWNAAKDAANAAVDTSRRTAEAAGQSARSVASWAIPMLIVAAVGALLWSFLGRDRAVEQVVSKDMKTVTAMRPTLTDMPALPTASELTSQFGDISKSLTDAFAGIRDATTAEAAAPALESLKSKLDAFDTTFAQLPESTRATLKAAMQERSTNLKEQATQALSRPGIGERIQALIRQIVQKLEELGLIA